MLSTCVISSTCQSFLKNKNRIISFYLERQSYREGEREVERNLPSAHSLFKLQQSLWFSQVKARNQEIHPGLPYGYRDPRSWHIINKELDQKWSKQDCKRSQCRMPELQMKASPFVPQYYPLRFFSDE